MEQGDDPLAVGDGGGRGEAVLEMNRAGRHAAIRLALPQFLSAGEVVTEDQETMLALAARLPDVEAHLGLLVTGDPGGARQEDLSSPDDRRRPSEPGHVRFPCDILLGAPLDGRIRSARRQFARTRPAKCW